MLNATIPNELRWCAPKSRGLATSPRPSLGLCLSLVEMILETANEATRYFLNLKDEESGLPYWYSIEDDTRLALSLLSIHGKNVMILEPEVRTWALEKLKEEIESPVKYNGSNSTLPSEWLKEIITGTFCNAECDIGMGLDARIARKSVAEFQFSKDENSVCYRQDMLCVQDLVVPHKLSGGLDFDLLIPALLILVRRDENWREGTSISTQILLNVVCDMAGRKTDVEPKFMFDGATVMRQCALADNFQATSFLVGGKNGLILECADVVISSLGVTMKVAEVALFAGSVVEMEKIVIQSYHEFPIQEKTEFIPNESHHHLLWLLQQHVLNVRTYGEFSPTSNNRGKINPVFAGRVCFRAWICLTHPSLQKVSAKWLEGWLRRNLELVCGKSTKRLACAALVRVLLWTVEASELDLSDGDDDPLLAALVGFDGRFMAELAQACCGLIESIPPHLAEEIMSGLGGSNLFSFETGLLNAV